MLPQKQSLPDIAQIWYEDRWYFSISDLVKELISCKDAQVSWAKIKRRLKREGAVATLAQCKMLRDINVDAATHGIEYADTETMLRIIQSIPSPRAEPFKQWLAKVGTERLEEIENPEILTERQRSYYKAKGYPDEWIEARMRGIQIRNELTEEWAKRGAEEGREYAILTAEIARETFDVIPSAHSIYKGLSENENLRDHYTPLEVILMALGEATSKELHIAHDSQGFDELKEDAHEAGEVAGSARADIERRTGKPVVSPDNYLHLTNQPPDVIADSLPQQGKLLDDETQE